MCIRCSGIHRNLGVHISFVRSVSLDEWQTKHVKNSERWGRQCAVSGLRRACSRLSLLFSPPCLLLPVVRWGNRRANEYWEATVPEDYYIPDENDSVATVERCAPLVRSSNLQLQLQQPMAPPACPPPPQVDPGQVREEALCCPCPARLRRRRLRPQPPAVAAARPPGRGGRPRACSSRSRGQAQEAQEGPIVVLGRRSVGQADTCGSISGHGSSLGGGSSCLARPAWV